MMRPYLIVATCFVLAVAIVASLARPYENAFLECDASLARRSQSYQQCLSYTEELAREIRRRPDISHECGVFCSSLCEELGI